MELLSKNDGSLESKDNSIVKEVLFSYEELSKINNIFENSTIYYIKSEIMFYHYQGNVLEFNRETRNVKITFDNKTTKTINILKLPITQKILNKLFSDIIQCKKKLKQSRIDK